MNATSQSFLGRYRLVKVLGQGAMGVVYEAVDTRLGRTVAIKTVLRSHLADETTANEYASRFEREAQAAARLSHPHVVTVYDFGEHEDISYIVMEFVRGRELNQAFESGERFALPDAVRIMCELLQALDYAHQQGIVHRDVKPANVMLDHAGRVKLTDFGVARVANANQDRTMPGTLVGTPSYMSPEQILGLAVGSRADIFAAGVILYQFLTGKRPFAGGGPFGVQRKIVQDDPDAPTQLNPTLPAAFDVIVAKALAKQPENRYESAAAFAADLERVAATLAREVPLIDLDLGDDDAMPPPAAAPARAPAAAPGSPAPAAAAPPAAAPDALTLITAVPFGTPGAPVPPPEPTLSDADPEATVLMFKPTAPAPVATPRPTAPAAPAAAPPAPTPAPAVSPLPRPAGMAMDAVRPSPPPPAAPASPPAPRAAAPTPAGAAATPASTARPVAPPARPAAPPARAPARVVHVQPPPASRRTASDWWPMAAGALVAAFALGTWLVVAKPWTKTRAADAYGSSPSTAAPALPAAPPPAAAGSQPASVDTPGTASVSTSPAPTAAAAPATAAPEPAATASPPVATPSTAGTAGSTGSAAPPPAAPERRPEATKPAPPPRKPAADAAPTPAPRPRADERPAAVEARCSDLLQRMQLGEPLSTEQTAFFQTRCTR